MPNCANRSVRRTSFGEGNASVASKPRTSPAIVHEYPSVSNALILLIPHSPAVILRQKESIPWPTGETTPMPVTTIRFRDGAVIKQNRTA